MTSSARHVIAAVQAGLIGGLVLVAGILAARRLAGGSSVPLSTAMLTVTGAAFAASCLIGRLIGLQLQRPAAPNWLSWLWQAARFVPLAACWLLVAGVLLQGTALAGGCVLVALLAVEETWCFARLPTRWALPRDGVGSQFRGHARVLTGHNEAATKLTPDPFTSAPLTASDEALDQQWARRRTPNGEEVIEGLVRVRLGAGQRTAEAHIAFCPPLEQRPRVEFEAESGPPARIDVGQVLPVGARFDVKLAQASEQETAIVVRFAATAESRGDRAPAIRCA